MQGSFVLRQCWARPLSDVQLMGLRSLHFASALTRQAVGGAVTCRCPSLWWALETGHLISCKSSTMPCQRGGLRHPCRHAHCFCMLHEALCDPACQAAACKLPQMLEPEPGLMTESCRWDNFQFVNCTEVMTQTAHQAPAQREALFALRALMEIPDQYRVSQPPAMSLPSPMARPCCLTNFAGAAKVLVLSQLWRMHSQQPSDSVALMIVL